MDRATHLVWPMDRATHLVGLSDGQWIVPPTLWVATMLASLTTPLP